MPPAKRAAVHRRLGQGVVVSRVVARLHPDRRPPAITRWADESQLAGTLLRAF